MTLLPAPPGTKAAYSDPDGTVDYVPVLYRGTDGWLVGWAGGELMVPEDLPFFDSSLGPFLAIELPESTDPLIQLRYPVDPVPVWLYNFEEGADAIGWAFTAGGDTCPILDIDNVPRVHRGPWRRYHEPAPKPWSLILQEDGWIETSAEHDYWTHPSYTTGNALLIGADDRVYIHEDVEGLDRLGLTPKTAYDRAAWAASRAAALTEPAS